MNPTTTTTPKPIMPIRAALPGPLSNFESRTDVAGGAVVAIGLLGSVVKSEFGLARRLQPALRRRQNIAENCYGNVNAGDGSFRDSRRIADRGCIVRLE